MTNTQSKSQLRMIVADDAPFIREIVRNLAEKDGIELVGEAVDGLEAVEKALQFKPDVVLMDIIMPRKNGIDAAREILTQLPSTKIIAFSTADQETMVIQALDAGCCNYVLKPFEGGVLLSVIKKAVA
jgi:two-component system, chemotaxis family, chemotaxis protein CheY